MCILILFYYLAAGYLMMTTLYTLSSSQVLLIFLVLFLLHRRYCTSARWVLITWPSQRHRPKFYDAIDVTSVDDDVDDVVSDRV